MEHSHGGFFALNDVEPDFVLQLIKIELWIPPFFNLNLINPDSDCLVRRLPFMSSFKV